METPGASRSAWRCGPSSSRPPCGRPAHCHRPAPGSPTRSLLRACSAAEIGGPPKGWVGQAFRGCEKQAAARTMKSVSPSRALRMDISRGKGGDHVLGSLRIQLAREEGQALIEYAL